MSHTITKKPTREEINGLISLPNKLTTDDGRELRITSWKPCVAVDELVRVEVLACVVKGSEPAEGPKYPYYTVKFKEGNSTHWRTFLEAVQHAIYRINKVPVEIEGGGISPLWLTSGKRKQDLEILLRIRDAAKPQPAKKDQPTTCESKHEAYRQNNWQYCCHCGESLYPQPTTEQP